MHFVLKHLTTLGLLAASALAVPMPQGATAVIPVAAQPPKIKFGYLGNKGPKLWPELCQDVAPGQVVETKVDLNHLILLQFHILISFFPSSLRWIFGQAPQTTTLDNSQFPLNL